MIRVFLLLYILSFTLMAKGQLLLGMESPKYESRAVWLTTIGGIDWPHSYAQSSRTIQKQQEELCTILDQLQQAGVNQVLLQTRIRATTLYPSSLEPWDGCLSGIPGKSPGYDALAFAIECPAGIVIHTGDFKIDYTPLSGDAVTGNCANAIRQSSKELGPTAS